MLTRRAGKILALFSFLLLTASCASLSHYKGVGRIRRYTITDSRLPRQFDGKSIAFVSDTHYPSKFTGKRLVNAARALNDLNPDILLLGGDYVTSIEYAEELFTALSSSNTRYGKYAILGNHDTRIKNELEKAMVSGGIELLANETDTIRDDGAEIFICGVKDYNTTEQPEWIRKHTESGFTIILAHSPDYAQDTRLQGASLVLSGHTHGGQVTLLGLYVPINHSHYGRRFLSGLSTTDSGVPVITSNGLGTSRKKIRFCAPSDIIFVTLKKE
jgi:predicted MPP superfamily phosphohydrolase